MIHVTDGVGMAISRKARWLSAALAVVISIWQHWPHSIASEIELIGTIVIGLIYWAIILLIVSDRDAMAKAIARFVSHWRT